MIRSWIFGLIIFMPLISDASSFEPKTLEQWEERYGEDQVLKNLFGKDRNQLSFDRKYLPTENAETHELIYPTFRDVESNAVSTYLQAFSSGNDDVLQFVGELADYETEFDINQNNSLLKLHTHSQNYLFLKNLLLHGLPDGNVEHPLTGYVAGGLRSSISPDSYSMSFDQVEFPTKTKFDSNWQNMNQEQRYWYLSHAQELMFFQALYNAEKAAAMVSMYLAKHPDRDTWKAQTEAKLNHWFCTALNQNPHFKKDLTEVVNLKPKCEFISNLVIQDIREWVPLDEALKRIAKSMNFTQGALIEAENAAKERDLTETDWEFQRYPYRYSMATSGPGIAILKEPLKTQIGALQSLQALNEGRSKGHWVPPQHPSDDPETYQRFQELTIEALKNARDEIIQSFGNLTDHYNQKAVSDWDLIKDAAKKFVPGAAISSRQNDLRDLVRYQPLAVVQVVMKNPSLIYLLQQQLYQAITQIRKEELNHKITTGVITGVGAVLAVVGAAELVTGGAIAAMIAGKAGVAAIVGMIELGVGAADWGYSEYYSGEKAAEYRVCEQSLLQGNHVNHADIQKSYDEMLEANTARAWARGGALLMLPQVRTIYKSLREGVAIEKAFAKASFVGHPIDKPQSSEPNKIWRPIDRTIIVNLDDQRLKLIQESDAKLTPLIARREATIEELRSKNVSKEILAKLKSRYLDSDDLEEMRQYGLLIKEWIKLQKEIGRINYALITKAKKVFEANGFVCEIQENVNGIFNLRVVPEKGTKIFNLVKKYFRNESALSSRIGFIYDPVRAKSEGFAMGVVNTNILFDSYSIRNFIDGEMDELIHHEIKHLFMNNMKESFAQSIYHQRFSSINKNLVENPRSPYSDFISAQEISAYADTVYLLSKKITLPDYKHFESLLLRATTAHKINLSLMQNSHEVVQAIRANAISSVEVNSLENLVEISYGNGKTYAFYTTQSAEHSLLLKYELSSSDETASLYREAILALAEVNLTRLNLMAYNQLLHLDDIINPIHELSYLMSEHVVRFPSISITSIQTIFGRHFQDIKDMCKKYYFSTKEKAATFNSSLMPEGTNSDYWPYMVEPRNILVEDILQ